jgi:hypothetical protein
MCNDSRHGRGLKYGAVPQVTEIVSTVSRLGTMTGSAMNSEEDIFPVSDLHACSYYDWEHSVMVV